MDNIVTTFTELENVYQFAKEKHLEEIRFEFIMSALFPNIYDNIKKEMFKQHALGYAEGLRDK